MSCLNLGSEYKKVSVVSFIDRNLHFGLRIGIGAWFTFLNYPNKMNEKEFTVFDRKNCPSTRKVLISVSKTTWQISLYREICDVMGIEKGVRIKFFQDKNRLKDWYVMKCESNDNDGFLVKHYVSSKKHTDHFSIYNRVLVAEIFNSLKLEGTIIRFRLGTVERLKIKEKEAEIYPIIVMKSLSNLSKDGV